MSNDPLPEWLLLLNGLLVRDHELDQLAHERYQQDQNRQKAPLNLHNKRLIDALFSYLRKYNCRWCMNRVAGWIGAAPFEEEFPQEEEPATLRAFREWLKPAPEYPLYATPEEQRELREMRLRLDRAALDRLRQLESAGGMLNEDGPTPPNLLWWRGDRHELSPRLWSVTNFMWNKQHANVQDLAKSVWADEGLSVSD